MSTLKLVSSHLCPYVQRAAIALSEKQEPFERIYIDTANKPDWFNDISPLGKVPLLIVGEDVVFESAVILEYLEDTMTPRLHPVDPLRRADHRAWIEYGSTILNDLSGFYRTADQQTFEEKRALLTQRFARLEQRLVADPWFDGERFSLVDAVFGPVFRYFDLFDQISDFGILQGKPKIEGWRSALAERPSVRKAVPGDYPQRLNAFIRSLNSHLAKMMPAPSTAA
jgi:glutathione S-transferase